MLLLKQKRGEARNLIGDDLLHDDFIEAWGIFDVPAIRAIRT